MSLKPLVYLAGPYSKGDQALNVRCQIKLWTQLMIENVVTPYAPLLSHFVHLIDPQEYEIWMLHSFEMLEHCDAMLSRDAVEQSVNYRQSESSGRDREIRFCKERGLPIFQDIQSLYSWAIAFPMSKEAAVVPPPWKCRYCDALTCIVRNGMPMCDTCRHRDSCGGGAE